MILITQPRVGKSANEIIALQMAAESLGWEVLPATYGWRLEDELINSGKVGVPYGSWTFCEVIAQQMNWKLKRNAFDWLASLPEEYLKRKVEFMTLGEAKKITERKFIKPADDKCFDAKVYEPGEFKPHEVVADDYPTLVSEPVKFTHEYRCFVSDFKVRTWSNYIYEDNLAEPAFWEKVPDGLTPPHEFVQEMLLDIGTWWGCPDSIYNTTASVIDVGYIPGKGWAIIETNECFASGLYGCDPVEAVKVMGAACERIS